MPLRDEIRRKLATLQRRQVTDGYTRQAAVLMPVFERDGEAHVLLTRRTEEVETHKGQISFPGGERHEGETFEKTALRETFEEVGIQESGIEVLGRFHDYLSSTEYLVVPFAGYIEEPFTTRPEPQEVAEVLQVPFHVFMDPKRLRTEKMVRSGKEIEVYFYTYDTYEIWGLTARILKDFLEFLQEIR